MSGSSRDGNNTIRLSRATKNMLNKEGYEASLIDFKEYDIPFFNGGYLNRANATEFQENIYSGMSQADVIIIYSPEYNWFPSAEIINLLNQIAGEKNADLFNEKVFVFGGVSSGRGGKLPAIQLSSVVGKVINFLNFSSMVSSKIFESSFTQDHVNENGIILTEDTYKEEFVKFIHYSIKIGLRWKEKS
jgi:chromate reductase